MAKHIEIRLALPVVGPLVDFVRTLVASRGGRLPAEPDLRAIDADLRERWRDDLIASHQADLGFFMDLFEGDFRTTGVVGFPEAACDSVVRACSTVRLMLRTTVLARVPDESMEDGSLDPGTLGEDGRTGYMAYAFLASLQEVLVRNMDPEIGEG